MGKIKVTSQNDGMKNMQITLKKRKKRGKRKMLRNVEKSNPKIENVSNEIQKNIPTFMQKKKKRNNQSFRNITPSDDIKPAKTITNFGQKKPGSQNTRIIKKKINRIFTNTETQQAKSGKLNINNHKIKIARLHEMLSSRREEMKKKPNPKINPKSLSLRDRMMAQLKSSRFRFINETLYNNESSQSKQYFKEDPDAFIAYHDGYKQQIEQWPVNPLDVIISSIVKMPIDNIIADFGCGEARLAASIPHKVHSFDFLPINDRITACDMAHTQLLTDSIHVVVFCLSLMGTNLNDYIIEANRVLKNNGILKIAEVESRFENVEDFIKLMGNYGFKNTWKDLSHNLFYFMDFKKTQDIRQKRKNLPPITLKSCLYKKR